MADSALAFVGEINAEHEAVTKGESTALQHAIKCGALLNLAKENVKAEKKKWGAWLSQHCPKIPQTTASLYMRLADNKDDIAGATSIRDAIQKLGTTRERTTKFEPAKPKHNGSPDLTTLLADSAPDEIKIAMNDAGVRVRVVASFEPKELSQLLLQVWGHSSVKWRPC